MAAFLIALAAILRAGALTQPRSLWIDEARLAMNVASRSYLELFPPLDYDQAAPLLFLWLERLAVDVLGVSEISLRLVPLATGVATAALVFPLGRRLFGERVALLATLLCALSPSLISASTEAKQYGVEAFVTCLVLVAGLKWLEQPSLGRHWLSLLGLGVIGVWMAPSVVFTLTAILAAILFAGEMEWRRRARAVVQAMALWGASLALAYGTVYVHASTAPYFQRYWSAAFLTPGRKGVLLDSGAALSAVLWSPLFRDRFAGPGGVGVMTLIPAIAVVIALILIIGIRRLVREAQTPARALVLLPPAIALAASALRAYPISARTTLFFLPVLILLLAAGVEEVSRLVRRPVAATAVVLTPALLLLLVATREFFRADSRENMRPLVVSLGEQRKSGEAVYVFAGAIPAWAFYSTNWHRPDWQRLHYLRSIAGAEGPAFENAPGSPDGPRVEAGSLVYEGQAGVELYGRPTGMEAGVFRLAQARPDPGWASGEARRIRMVANPSVWLLFSHFHGPEGELLQELERAGGRRTYEDMRNGAALVRYNFASGATPMHREVTTVRLGGKGSGVPMNAAMLVAAAAGPCQDRATDGPVYGGDACGPRTEWNRCGPTRSAARRDRPPSAAQL